MENKYWIGIDFGGTNIRVGLFKEDMLIHENKFLTEADRGPDYTIENIKKNIFAPNMKERFERYIYPTMRGKIQVKASQLSEPGMLGAMYLVKQKVKNINSKEVL